MPLPQQKPHWIGRIAVTLLVAAITAGVIPLTRLLRWLKTPDIVAYAFLTLWMLVLVAVTLWALRVWAPKFGKWVLDQINRTPPTF